MSGRDFFTYFLLAAVIIGFIKIANRREPQPYYPGRGEITYIRLG